MLRRQWGKPLTILFILFFLFLHVFPTDAFARVGGGSSSGSRGSRSSTPPRQYSPTRPSQPSQPSTPPSQVSPQPQSPFLRSLAGGILGGMLGGMLFRSLGYGSDLNPEGGGIGLFDILTVGLIFYGIYWLIKRRRQAALASGYDQSSAGTVEAGYPSSCGQTYHEKAEEDRDLEKGLSYIRQMDSSFDERKFTDLSMDHFFKVQGAWATNDISGVKPLLTEEMFRVIGDDIARLKLENKVNKLENIAVRSVDMVEAWQESGRDYITVKFCANLLDYTVNKKTGELISGSKTEPVKFEEYWTFTRSVGNNPWELSAINQVE